MHMIWNILAHSQTQQYRGSKHNHRWHVWILLCIWTKKYIWYESFWLNWIFNPSALLCNNICNKHEHWWLPPQHLNIQSWLPIELGWQKGVVGLWAVSGSSSRPGLGMYSDHCHQWRQSRDLLLAKPQSWTMVAARRLGEKIMVLLSQLNIFRSIPYHHHPTHTRLAPGSRMGW